MRRRPSRRASRSLALIVEALPGLGALSDARGASSLCTTARIAFEQTGRNRESSALTAIVLTKVFSNAQAPTRDGKAVHDNTQSSCCGLNWLRRQASEPQDRS